MLLDIALQYAGRGWAVFPLSASKLPFKGSHGFLDASTDPARIQELWQGRRNANIGLATGRIVVVDPDGPTAVARLMAIGAAHGGWPRTLTAKTPRSIHLFYATPANVEIRSWNERRATKGADGIDIKGAGGYVVLAPSRIKKDGQVAEYSWLIDAPIAELPPWGLDFINSLKGEQRQILNNDLLSTPLPAHLQRSNRNNPTNQAFSAQRLSAALGTPWSQREESRIREALAAVPARGYDRWVQIGMALHSLDWCRSDGTDIGFDLFDEWSGTEPELYSLDATEKKWQSFGRSGRSGIGLGTLYHIAEQCGWQGLAPPEAPAEAFDPFGVADLKVNGQINGHVSAPNVLPEALTAPSAESPLIMLNQKYACIGDIGGKCLVLGWVPSKVDPTIEVPSFQSFKSFAERFGHRYVMVRKETKDGGEEQEPKQLGAYWLKWRSRRSYDGIDLIPGEPAVLGNNALNLWRGFAVMPTPGTWERMKAHIGEVLADGNAAALDYILRWSAWAVQNPGERGECALVFRGGKGSGKGTFAHALRRIFGAHGLHISNPKHLVGAFNAHLRNCLMLYADEAFWAGDKQGESTLKALITESTLTIEQKGVDAVQWHNRIHLIMTANAEWVVPASHDERRYAMFNVSEKRMNDSNYFNLLHQELEAGGLAAMLHDLQNVDLGSWHPRQVLRTAALTEQKMQSMAPLTEWWEAMLQDATIPAAPKDTPDAAMAVFLLNHARDFAPRLRELTPTKLGRFLADHGCTKIHRGNGNAWRFPMLAEARDKWARRYQGWKWEREATGWQART